MFGWGNEVSSQEEKMDMEKLATRLSIFVFVFWGYGIYEDPNKASIIGWFAWMIIVVAVGVSRRLDQQPANLWFAWAAGDVLMIIWILYLGGNNWEYEPHIPYLVAGGEALAFSLVYGKRFPWWGELLGGLSLAFAYVPHIWPWIQPDHAPSWGYLAATIVGITSPILLGIHSRKTTEKFGIGNVFAILSPFVLLVVLVRASI